MGLYLNGVLYNDHYDLTIGAVAGDGDNIANPMSCMIIFPTADNDTISGFVPPGTLTGQMLWILNTDATKNIVLKNNSTSSVGNRIFTKTGADFTLAPQQFAQLMFMDAVRVGWWQVS